MVDCPGMAFLTQEDMQLKIFRNDQYLTLFYPPPPSACLQAQAVIMGSIISGGQFVKRTNNYEFVVFLKTKTFKQTLYPDCKGTFSRNFYEKSTQNTFNPSNNLPTNLSSRVTEKLVKLSVVRDSAESLHFKIMAFNYHTG